MRKITYISSNFFPKLLDTNSFYKNKPLKTESFLDSYHANYTLSDKKELKRTKHYYQISAKNMYGTTTKNYIIKTNDTRYLINGAPDYI